MIYGYATGRDMEAAAMKTGPNDARHVVWALGECFLFFFVFYNTS